MLSVEINKLDSILASISREGGRLAVEGCIPQSPLATAPFKGSQDSATHSSERTNPSVAVGDCSLKREPRFCHTFIRANESLSRLSPPAPFDKGALYLSGIHKSESERS